MCRFSHGAVVIGRPVDQILNVKIQKGLGKHEIKDRLKTH